MQIRRDPIARHSLKRTVIKQPIAGGCSWCGSHPRRLYMYTTETDGGSKYTHRGQFCDIRCHDSYHG